MPMGLDFRLIFSHYGGRRAVPVIFPLGEG